jgi:hypothetical protein
MTPAAKSSDIIPVTGSKDNIQSVEVSACISAENISGTGSKDKLAMKKGGSLAKLFKKDKSSASPSGANGSQTSLHNIFQSFDDKNSSKVKTERQLFSGSFGEAWKGRYKDRGISFTHLRKMS